MKLTVAESVIYFAQCKSINQSTVVRKKIVPNFQVAEHIPKPKTNYVTRHDVKRKRTLLVEVVQLWLSERFPCSFHT